MRPEALTEFDFKTVSRVEDIVSLGMSWGLDGSDDDVVEKK